jgi:cbb3-type cytochrome oxidase maturation protein
MSVIFVVLPVALLLGAAAVGGFVWATKRGQFDDLTTPALRALQDDSERLRGPQEAPEQGSRGEPQRGRTRDQRPGGGDGAT